MGAWRYQFPKDHLICNVIGMFEELLKAGSNVRDASQSVKVVFAIAIQRDDYGPLFWIALADMQWAYGNLEPSVLDQVREDLKSGRTLGIWTKDQQGLARRRESIEKFISKISTENPIPKKQPKIVVRAPKFQAGDCLSIRLDDGQYAAAIVLLADHSNLEVGQNLVGFLDYLAPEKPKAETYRERKWFFHNQHSEPGKTDLAWYIPPGFRKVRDRIEVVCKTAILETDPKDSNIHCGWGAIAKPFISQRARDSKPS